ncbi:MAG: LysR family transcriptional regulator, partial [Nitrococcus sp.]|nr:LysR family transcriptional regulator [Nitrococcus sp.]
MYLELRHLRTLQAIRATGSLARAAARLHLTQSALSHQIKALEQHFDTPLFFRNSRPLRFSPAGELLLALAERLLPEVKAVEQRLSGMAHGRQGRLHIAIECHSCFQWLLPTMDHYREDWPGVEMDLSLGFSFHPLPALVRGEIDLVVTSDPDPDLQGIHYEPLFRHEVLLAMSLGSPLAAKRWLEPHDLAAETLITYPVCRSRLDVFARFLDPAGVEPAAVRTSELTVMIIQLVVSGRGVAALPNWALDEYRG